MNCYLLASRKVSLLARWIVRGVIDDNCIFDFFNHRLMDPETRLHGAMGYQKIPHGLSVSQSIVPTTV